MDGDAPLAGVKVLDFTWVMAGPSALRVLADYGATVVKVESTLHVDTARTMAPFIPGADPSEGSVLFQNVNAGKLGITLDPSKDAGREVVLDLVRWADVVAESFSPKVMRSWRLGYESLRAAKPDIIMLSACLMGQTGPLSRFAGFGSLASAISGFYELTGWPDRPPAGPFGAYTDTMAPRFMAVAILAALDRRRRTGQGQYIDQSQAESALHFLAPALLDYTANGRAQGRAGNRDTHFAPHGVYPAAGNDKWVAVAVETDEQWRALCRAIGRDDLLFDERFGTAEGRVAGAELLDEAVVAWTRDREASVVESLLQKRGVPASAVQHGHALFADEQLRGRDHFVEAAHPVHGTVTIEGSRFRLSRTPARIERAAPALGGDNQHVLAEILGYSEPHIADLVAQGVLQ